jgi:predicted transcriptional regulator
MNVITNSNSGAFLADWFIKKEDELIDYLSEQSKTNLNSIQSFCN